MTASVATIAAPRFAHACGGFFCSTQPVVQTGEQIIFGVDEEAGTVDAIIQINYQGSAEEFAWVLPLQAAPESIGVGTTRLFQMVESQTRPRFIPSWEISSMCRGFFRGGGPSDAGASAADAGIAGGDVTVLFNGAVGPYETVVISSPQPSAIQTWLNENGYRVTEEMMAAVVPYLAQGDVLLALKLRKDGSVGDLQPISVRMNAAEACIPIRLTAIAAQADMGITALVLSNQGRAIPSNYLHIEPNWALLNWVQGGANYRSLIAAAADEAMGQAFTTEYYGPSNILRGQIYNEREYDLSEVRAATNLTSFFLAINATGLQRRSELLGILQQHVSESVLIEAGVDISIFWACPTCWQEQLANVAYDPNPAANEIEARIIHADRDAQALFDRFEHLTRLYTLLSPEEMTLDPIFDFRADQPMVSNTHRATIYAECNSDGSLIGNRLRVELEDGTRVYVDTFGNVDPSLASQLPSAERIDNAMTGEVVADSRPKIKELLGSDERSTSNCGCKSVAGTDWAGAAFFAFMISAIALERARSRRRR